MTDRYNPLSAPPMAVVLRILLERPDGVEEEELLVPGAKADEIRKSVEILTGYGMAVRTSGRLAISKDEEILKKARKMAEAFSEIETAVGISLIVRGILTATTYYPCLVHRETLVAMLAEEGIPRDAAERVLLSEERQGYIHHLAITYRSRGGVKEKFFPFVPYHHYDDFAGTTGRIVEISGEDNALPGQELLLSREDYLLGSYPEGLAEEGRRYLTAKNYPLLQKIRNEAFDIVWYYDRY